MSAESSQISVAVPLIDDGDNHDHQQHHHHQEPLTVPVNKSLRRLESFLCFLGFFNDTPLSLALSTFCFLLLAVAAPALATLVFYCTSASSASCRKYHLKHFELETLICQITAAATSLTCVSINLRKYGLRKFLFVDRYHGNYAEFQRDYVPKIDNFFRSLAIWLLPLLILKTAREIAKVIYVDNDSVLQSMVIIFTLLVSWTYSATIYLSGSTLFSLVCNLQVIHFENYKKLLESNLDVLVYIEEHSRLTYHLSKISHRFRIFLILEFLIVTASQFVTLLETTGNSGTINFINGADFAISSIVQVVGITICLHAAAKISHRAQTLASFASRWHALGACRSNETLGSSGKVRSFDTENSAVQMVSDFESDFESPDYMSEALNTESVSYMSSYYKRQAFVMYMQSNPGGITIFGWTVDRTLLDTIFFLELSVATFVLGKTITFSKSTT